MLCFTSPVPLPLAFQVKDVAPGYTAKKVEDALKLMDGRGSSVAKRNVYAEKLRGLGEPVIPILYTSRSGIVLNGAMDEKMLAAIGENCIVAEGIGEPTLIDPWDKMDFDPCIDEDTKWNDVRLHRIRRSMMLFDFRKDQCADVEDLASVFTEPLTFRPAPAVASTGVHGFQACAISKCFNGSGSCVPLTTVLNNEVEVRAKKGGNKSSAPPDNA
ncbi:Hypothetical protein, putative [Bodo saltans]|uniref:Uncharacterized protein n=1 Tax=Bodo saltans TaxID=75058 RepID=A0A0S4INY3_BODSA|nr:Hypothetical protein, putative [Bodo saltans]|eukprot:CUE72133.1 Hypothetical protein, putative [Bodo saltans]